MTKPTVTFTPEHLDYINSQLAELEPQQILEWALITFPGLYQTTAFGLTGLVTVDMISKLRGNSSNSSNKHAVDLIFIDTLHHFKETLELVDRVKEKYGATIHVYKPDGCATREDFTKMYGEESWEVNEDIYDYAVKVEPADRAYKELGVVAVLTGRRKSQGGARNSLKIVEFEELTGVYKINPMANWSFAQVKAYVDEHKVPYNVLLDQGYKSIGDYHSTFPVGEGEDERSGRWKGKAKTECGIHDTSRFAQFLAKKAAA